MKFKSKLYFLLLALYLFFMPSGYALVLKNDDKISLELNNTSLFQVFHEIEKQTLYKFFYIDKDINIDQKINIKVKEESIDNVLSELLNKYNIDFKIIKNRIILKRGTPEIYGEQEYIIQGKVIDQETREPIINCSIILNNTNKATSTNALGEFEIKVSSLYANTELIFKHLNYETQAIIVSGTKPKLVSLTPLINDLEAVFISGKKKDYYAIDLAKKAFNTTVQSSNKSKYGRALYRQTSKNGNDYSEFAEIIYDIRYSNSGIEDWDIIEGRYALKRENINNKNFTLLSRLMRSIQPNTEDLFFPLNRDLESQYDIEVLEHLISESNKIAVLWFKPKKKNGTNAPLFEGEVYINTNTYEVLKITGEIARDDLRLIQLTEQDTDKKNYRLSYEMAFKTDSLGLTIDYIDVNQEFDYYLRDTFKAHVSARSNLNFFEYYKPISKKRLGRSSRASSSDWQKLNEIGYNKKFWDDNPIVKRTPIEEDVIAAFETDNAFESIFLNSRDQIAGLQANISNLPFVKDLTRDIRLYNDYNPIEKVYLHTDKDLYLPGEDIWFSSYVTLGAEHYFSLGSHVLYIEFIDTATGKVINTQELSLINGRGEGVLELQKSLPAGVYKIRSYTNWMRNEDEAFFFTKTINIIDETIVDNKELIVNNDDIDLQFFPEGGNMVLGLNNLIAFKGIGIDGLSRDIRGRIIDSNGKIMVTINSIDQGAGFFNLKPEEGVSYKAVLDNGQEALLPEVKTEGYVMSVNNDNERSIRVKVQATRSIKNKTFYIIGQTRNQKYYQARFGFGGKDVVDFEIPKNRFPSGVLTLTLLDEQRRPWSERVLFVDNEEEFSITVKSNKRELKSRDQIQLDIEVTDREGRPVSAGISIAITDADKVDKNENENTILTHLLLQSEVKGHIENPGLYFKDRKRSTRSQLDLVMLTHGWRRFNWDKAHNKTYDQDKAFSFEQGLTIAGIARTRNKKPLKNVTLNMRAKSKDDFKLYTTITDNNGNFKISNFDQSDEIEVEFNAYDITGSPIDVDVVLDKKKEKESKHLPYLKFKYPNNIGNRIIKKYIEISRQRQEIDSIYELQFSLEEINELEEVIVEAEAEKEEIRSEVKPLYDGLITPDAVLEFDESNNNVNFIDQLSKIPGVRVSGSGETGFSGRAVRIRNSESLNDESITSPLWIVDGIPFESDINFAVPQFIADLNTLEIDRVELLKGPKASVYGFRGSGGVIIIYRRQDRYKLPDTNIVSPDFSISGFEKIKEFYIPKYDVKKETHIKPDYRTTLYWEPNLKTDKNGKTSIEFFNSDITKSFQVDIQGLSIYGTPGVYLKTFGDNN